MARLERGSGASTALMVLSMACLLVAALAVDTHDWWSAGLRGDASGQGATLSAQYYVLRWVRGMAPGLANKTLEALRILFIYAAFEGTAGLLLPRLAP